MHDQPSDSTAVRRSLHFQIDIILAGRLDQFRVAIAGKQRHFLSGILLRFALELYLGHTTGWIQLNPIDLTGVNFFQQLTVGQRFPFGSLRLG